MFAISFDMLISDLKEHYRDPYNNAYYEIATILEKYDFYRGQGSVYLSTKNDMANLLRAVNALKNTPWFKNSVRDIRAFRVEDWSDFTSFIKED
ncbi:virulence protein [Fluviicola sp.]|uniref:virulence protein n=1 Tax=Fluviicola sp. TaxID=1917219 RepID=UPI0031D04E67